VEEPYDVVVSCVSSEDAARREKEEKEDAELEALRWAEEGFAMARLLPLLLFFLFVLSLTLT